MVWPILIGAAVGAMKGRKDEIRERQQVRLAAELMRRSPWTGMQVDPMSIKRADMMGSVVQGGLTGAAMGANYMAAAAPASKGAALASGAASVAGDGSAGGAGNIRQSSAPQSVPRGPQSAMIAVPPETFGAQYDPNTNQYYLPSDGSGWNNAQ